MPRVLVNRAWTSGVDDIEVLAAAFEVSSQAMHIRLQRLGLIPGTVRCATPTGLIAQRTIRPARYFRQASASFHGVAA